MKLSRIISIKEISSEPTIDIEVSGNNLFIANGILTHNSGFSNTDADMTDTSECIYINEMVTLRNGSFKTMNDINIGDQILANDEFKTVMFKHHNKMKDCVRITTESGKSIIVSKQHIFPTKNSAGIISRCSVSTGLMIGDKLHTK